MPGRKVLAAQAAANAKPVFSAAQPLQPVRVSLISRRKPRKRVPFQIVYRGEL
jgi:hypothetical protein